MHVRLSETRCVSLRGDVLGRGLSAGREGGSALECAAIVDAFQALQFVLAAEADRARELLERIVSMLTKMTRAGQ
jgi:hypothetical protein